MTSSFVHVTTDTDICTFETPSEPFSEINTVTSPVDAHSRELLMEAKTITVRFPNPVEQAGVESTRDEEASTTNSYTHKSATHAFTVLSQLNQQRREGTHCDITIQCGSRRFSVHKNILAASSQYFCNIFEDSTQNADALQMLDMNETTMEKLIEFMYTGELQITAAIVKNLLVAATILKLVEAQEACLEFLQQRLHQENYFSVLRLADLLGHNDLASACVRLIGQNFECLEKNDEFLVLSGRLFTKLISAEDWSSSEDSRLRAIIRWVGHSFPERQETGVKLVKHVQIPRISKAYLLQLSEAASQDGTSPWLKQFLIYALSRQLEDKKEESTKIATAVDVFDVIVVAGGYGGKCDLECFDLNSETWSTSTPQHQQAPALPRVPILECGRAGCAGVVVDDLLFILGGALRSPLKSIAIYDQRHQCWTTGAEMHVSRQYLGAAVLDKNIYAIGGRDETTLHASVEVLKHGSTNWRLIQSMSCARCSPGVTAWHDRIFVAGGRGQSVNPLATAESYNPNTNTWTSITQLLTPRSGLQLEVLGNRIYAVGGSNPIGTACDIADVYFPETNSWGSVASMNTPRENLGLVSFNGFLYAIGGWDGQKRLADIERYDPSTDKWTILSANMHTARSASGVAVMKLKRFEDK